MWIIKQYKKYNKNGYCLYSEEQKSWLYDGHHACWFEHKEHAEEKCKLYNKKGL